MSGFGFLDEHGQPHPRVNAARVCDRTVDELIGLAKGIVADGVVNEAEAAMLVSWLEQNHKLAGNDFAVQHLTRRVGAMLSDGIIDEEERQDLFEILTAMIGGEAAPADAHALSTELPLTEPAYDVVFDECTFCLTGKFALGTRKMCEEVVTALGGFSKRSVTRDLDYLVIGSVGSRDWIHSSYGRKIEQAMKFNQKGVADIEIISEEHWSNWAVQTAHELQMLDGAQGEE